MFTGIIEAIGSITSIERKGNDARIFIRTAKLDLSDVKLGDSIAVNGVCLTAVELADEEGVWADVSGETLSRTRFADIKPGSRVNLEKALTPNTRLGGHLVSGHVDGIGEIIERGPVGRSVRFRIKTEDKLARYIAEKGSICVDGISLTVNRVEGAIFELNIVPHTLVETIMDDYQVGTQVNLEVDIIARYLERLLQGDKAAEVGNHGITTSMLAEYGFMK